jgi:YidC/Oxa1 family membrane protein insertase
MYSFVGFLQEAVFLGRPIQSDPGFIVGPIAWLFGTILSFMFEIVYWITPNNSLGFAIIMLTVVAMSMMLPLNIKAQRSMIKMQKLNPEIEKIKAKYGSKNDAETKQKISQETQALWAKHKVNPLGSCLPILIQMPLFFGLLYIMGQSYQYITVLTALYGNLSVAIHAVPDFGSILSPLAAPYIPDAWVANGRELGLVAQGIMFQNPFMSQADAIRMAVDSFHTTDVIVLGIPEHTSRVLDRFTREDWTTLLSQIPEYYKNQTLADLGVSVESVRSIAGMGVTDSLQTLYNRLQSIEFFFGLSLKEVSGWRPPGIIIPVLAVITTMASSWLNQLVNKPKDQQAKTMQTVMMTVMPLFMGFITVSFPAGVGLYWITSNLYRVVQQLIMNKKAGVAFRLPFVKEKEA